MDKKKTQLKKNVKEVNPTSKKKLHILVISIQKDQIITNKKLKGLNHEN